MKVAIFGAGATGCYLGGILANAQVDVTLICRDYVKAPIVEHGGIGLSDYLGNASRAMPSQIVCSIDELKCNEQTPIVFDIVFVMLKCQHIMSISQDLAAITDETSSIVFMQNGLGSFDEITNSIKQRALYQGITSFNVLAMENCTYHQGTEGGFICQAFPQLQQLCSHVNREREVIEPTNNIKGVLYSKLMLNLNNAINAVADIPLKQELEQASFRKLLAKAMKEWLAIVRAEEVQLVQFTKVKPSLVPIILSLPTWLFKLVAKQMLLIDPKARSSMWQDIQDGKLTEVDYLNGAVVRLGKKHGIETPVNQQIVEQIKQLEQSSK